MGERVQLYVYDLSQGLASTLSAGLLGKQLDGIWHTSIVAYGSEFYYGGGIQQDRPGTTPYGTPVKYHDLGYTQVPRSTFMDHLRILRPQFAPEKYDLFNHNCNNFSNTVSLFLTGKSIPDYILNLPREALDSPMGRMLRPMLDSAMGGGSGQSAQAASPFFPMGAGGGGFGLPQPYGSGMGSAYTPTMPAPSAPAASSASVIPIHTQVLTTMTPVTFEACANLSAIVTKLKSFIAEEDSTPLSAENSALLDTLATALSSSSPPTPAALASITSSHVQLLIDLTSKLPPSKLFPVLDLLRLLALFTPTSLLLSQNPSFATHLFMKLLSAVPANTTEVSLKPYEIMIQRLLCNLFAQKQCKAMLVEDETRLTQLQEYVAQRLSGSEAAQAKPSLCSLAFNLATFAPPQLGSDGEVALLSSLCHCTSLVKEEEAQYRILSALLRLISPRLPGDETGGNLEIAQTLEPDFSALISSSSTASERVKALAKHLQAKLRS